MSGTDMYEGEGEQIVDGEEMRRDLWQTMLSGLALTVPFFITLLVLAWTVDVARDVLSPLASVLIALDFVEGLGPLLVEGIAAALVLGVVFIVGLIARLEPKTNLGSRIDILMEDIPGIGSIYTSVERMSDAVLGGDTHSFQKVVLVEFPRQGSFAIAFLTADSPPAIEDAVGTEEMITVFVPLAPNPVMGGHLLTLPRDLVYDVDLTVEQGIEAIVTTGVAMDQPVPESAA